ncbi:hypothetical protein [Acinetobacter sp. BSP-28]|uniref:hypothetical protein n=1 Tax=Acinetobacter sp. BSP-28 TaxID=3344661 RepID=UPI00376F773B
MDNFQLSHNVKEDIFQKIDGIYCLVTQRVDVQRKCMDDFKNNKLVDSKLSLLNQTLNDASLNAMATLIDYYFIYCMLVIGANIEKIRKVQYRNVNKNLIINHSRYDKSIKEKKSLKLYREKFDIKIKEECGLPLNEINIHDYWVCYLGDALSSTLCEYGVNIPRRILFDFDKPNGSFKLPKEIFDFHECILPFYCNPCNSSGVKYNVYLDINNCLKHNTIPYVIYKMETFEQPSEIRIYELFKIENYKFVFLKDGFLKDISEISLDELREGLSCKANKNNFELCSLEEKWEIGSIIGVDHKNGYIDKKGDVLYFFLDSILILKTRDSVFVDANASYKSTLGKLFDEIKRGIKYLEHQQINIL